MKTQTRDDARRKAIRKAHQAALLLAKAKNLMAEAAEITDGDWGSLHADYLHWANQIGELLSSDHDEAGIGPTLTKFASRG